MDQTVSEFLLSQFSEFIAASLGLYFPRQRWGDLERGIGSAAQEFGFKDAGSCMQWLMSSPLTKDRVEILAAHLTVGETYFFREKRSFEILEAHIFPELIRSRRGTHQSLKIWSAGCCTGEEAYSIAILLRKMLPDLQDWQITILATDINPRFLRKASEGLYKEWSFRDTPLWIKEKYFRQKKGGYFEVLPDIKRMVTIFYLNLVEGAYPSLLNDIHTLDLIFCRNVLIYFAPEETKKVIQKFYLSLREGGWLVTGPGEAAHVLFSQFTTVNFPHAILYNKGSKGPTSGKGFGGYGWVAEDIPLNLGQTEGSHSPGGGTMPVLKEVLGSGEQTSPGKGTMQAMAPPGEGPIFPEKPGPSPRQPAEAALTGDLYREALMLYERGRYPEAAERAMELLSHEQEGLGLQGKTAGLLARAYADQGRLDAALLWCERALAADKLNPEYHYLLAAILQEQGQVEEAVRSLKRAIYLNQNFVLAHFTLGTLSRRRGKFKESARCFENALSLLQGYRQDDILPGSEGMTAGELSELMASMTQRRK